MQKALLVFDGCGDVVLCNQTACDLVDASDSLHWAPPARAGVDRRRLAARIPALARQIDVALRACVDTRPTARTIPISAYGAPPTLVLELLPVAGARFARPGNDSTMVQEPLVVGHLIDPRRNSRPDCAFMRALFSLTEAECRVMEACTEHHTVKALARALALSANTIKTHLRSIYVKTGCAGQTDLIKLIHSMAEG